MGGREGGSWRARGEGEGTAGDDGDTCEGDVRVREKKNRERGEGDENGVEDILKAQHREMREVSALG